MKKPSFGKINYFLFSILTFFILANISNANAQCSAAFTPSTLVVCGSGSVSFTNSSTGKSLAYLWNFGDPKSGSKDTSTAKNTTHIFNKAGVYNVKLIIIDSACTDSIIKTITVREIPIVRGDTALCIGSYKIGNPAVSGYSYEWRDFYNSFKLISTLSNPTISFTYSGNRMYYVKATNTTNGVTCTVWDTFIVRVLPNPKANAGTSKTICKGDSAVLGSVADTGSYYSWTSVPAGFTSNAANPVVKPSVSTKYVLKATHKAGGCTINDTVTVTTTSPNTNISGDSVVCQMSTISYYVNLLNKATYNWNVTGGAIKSGQGTEKINVEWQASGKGKITIKIADSSGCSDSGSLNNIVINPRPSPKISGDTLVCTNSAVHVYSTPNVAGHSYRWSINGGNIISGQKTESIKVNWVTSGNGTISVYETNLFGCSNLYNYNVKILQGAKPKIIGDTNICVNAINHVYFTDSVSGNNYTWSVFGGTIISGQGTNKIKVNWPKTGTGNLMVKEVTNSGCADSFSLKVNINDWPSPEISGDSVVCKNSTSFYSTKPDTGSKYLWSVNGGTIITGQGTNQITVSWTGNTPGKVSVKETNSSGCDSAVSLNNIVINPQPSPKIKGETLVCTNSAGHVYNTTNVAGNSYVWKVTGGTITSGQNTESITVSWNNTGTGIISLRETNLLGCDKTITDSNIIIISRPLPKITGDTLVCNNITNYNYSTFSNTGNSYFWTIKNGTITSGQGTNAVKVTWSTSGIGTITVKETNSYGCSDSFHLNNITIIQSPKPKIAGDSIVCQYTNNLDYKTSLVAGNSYIWSVKGGTITSGQGTNNIKVSWLKAGTGSIKVKEITSTGCTDSFSINNININSRPSPSITGDTIVCNNIPSVYSTPFNPGSQYSWTISGGTISTGQGTNQIKVNWTGSGQGSIGIKETNSLGCDSTVNLNNIKVNLKPVVEIIGDTSVCIGSVYPYKAAKGNSIINKWIITGGIIISGKNTDSILVSWINPTIASLKLIGITSSSCTDSVMLPVSVYPDPAGKISGATGICEGAIENYSSPNLTNSNYTWGVSNGGKILSGQGTKTISIQWTSAGNNYVTLLQSNSIGCTNIDTLSVKVFDLPKANFVSTPACTGKQVYFKDSSINAAKHKWYFGDGSTSDSVNPNHKYANAGQYNVSLAVYTSNGCYDSVSKLIMVNALPDPSFNATTVCEGDTTDFFVSDTSVKTHFWNFGNGNNSTAQNPKLLYKNAGIYYVTHIAVSSSGCADSVTKQVNVLSLPDAGFTSVKLSDTTFSFTANDTNLVSYSWDFGDGKPDTLASVIHTYKKDSIYNITLKVVNINGCNGFSDTTITVSKVTSLSNIIKPDFNIQLYPNPFTNTTTLKYSLTEKAKINIKLFDLTGREVVTLVHSEALPGMYLQTIDASQYKMPAGVYFVKVLINDIQIVKQIVKLH